jgi:mono/diheme cytochrome c family protein
MIRLVTLILLLAASAQAKLTPEQRAKLPSPASEQIDFAKHIQPIVEKSCVKCHGKGRDKGGFVFETRESLLKGGDSGPAVIVGNSAESLIIELVSGLDPDNVMPQKGAKLTSREVSLLRAWIDQGLKWDSTITFAKKEPLNLKPRKPELPTGKENPIDRILKTTGRPVDDRLFARRAFLDVIGMIPTATELAAFEKRPNRTELVRTLLARKDDYAQHWMTFWNDALRNDYKGTGYIDGGRKQITTWLYSALATNMPFDKFVSELINPSPSNEGFIKGIVWRGVVNASQRPEMQAAQNISQVFMGVNLKCASCHDSFINDWTLADAYGLASVFSDEPLELVQCDKPLGKTAQVRFLYPQLGSLDAKAPRNQRLKRLSEIVTSPGDGRLSRTIINRLWARFFGHGLVEPVDEMDNPAWNQDVLDWLAADLAEHSYDLKHTIELMLTSKAYQLPAVPASQENDKNFAFHGPTIRRLSAEQFLDALGQITGVWNGDAVPEINFSRDQQLDPTLASSPAKPRWIWSAPNATASGPAQTVYVRKTIELPSAPAEGRVVLTADNSFNLFINGKSVAKGNEWAKPKAIDIRKLLKPGKNTFAIAATNDEAQPGKKDVDQSNPAGLFFSALIRTKSGKEEKIHDFGTDSTWKISTNKVEAWEKTDFDDSTWTAASDLGAANAGPWNLGPRLAGMVANQEFASDCRAVLANADPLMTALGRPNREQVITTRASTATTLQALELTNGSTLANRIKAGAEILAAETNSKNLVKKLYSAALGRNPTSAELTTASDLVGSPVQREGVEDLLWVVTMLPEFQLIR